MQTRTILVNFCIIKHVTAGDINKSYFFMYESWNNALINKLVKTIQIDETFQSYVNKGILNIICLLFLKCEYSCFSAIFKYFQIEQFAFTLTAKKHENLRKY